MAVKRICKKCGKNLVGIISEEYGIVYTKNPRRTVGYVCRECLMAIGVIKKDEQKEDKK